MRGVRRLRGITVAAWLLCQIGTVVFTPVVALASLEDPSAQCTCPRGAEATCPMHHAPASGSKVCSMRGLNDQAIIVWGTTFGVITPVSEVTSARDRTAAGDVALSQFMLIPAR